MSNEINKSSQVNTKSPMNNLKNTNQNPQTSITNDPYTKSNSQTSMLIEEEKSIKDTNQMSQEINTTTTTTTTIPNNNTDQFSKTQTQQQQQVTGKNDFKIKTEETKELNVKHEKTVGKEEQNKNSIDKEFHEAIKHMTGTGSLIKEMREQYQSLDSSVLTSDAVNYLVLKYLHETGKQTTSFAFASESKVLEKFRPTTKIPQGLLISLIQKGLKYLELETEIMEGLRSDEFFFLQRVYKKIEQKTDEIEKDEGRKIEIENEKIEKKNQEKPIDSSNLTVCIGHTSNIFRVKWSPIEDLLATGSEDFSTRIWNFDRRIKNSIKNISEWELSICNVIKPSLVKSGESATVTYLDWSPDGQYLAIGYFNGEISITSSNGNLLFQLRKHNGPIFGLKWNTNGKYLLSGSIDKKVIVWDIDTQKPKNIYLHHEGIIMDLDWKDDLTFATCSEDKTISICKVGNPNPIKMFTAHSQDITSIRWSPNGKFLASCSDDSTIKIWDINKEKTILELKEHENEILSLEWSNTGPGTAHPNSKLLLGTSSLDLSVKIWDIETGRSKHTLRKHLEPVENISFSPNGKMLATASLDKWVHIWDQKKGRILKSFQAPEPLLAVDWNKSGDKLAVTSKDGIVYILQI
ncbi:wd40 repeat protein [Anaeramoeba flamelloides]|uniref:Wd40 repeat protein n=1 Tax=Anaeramoeba flamelloides TaxID=1746091 RepID=A0AAV7YSD4_9EUKA|nr:wd40 repeat protein [Anaeramoeba flamelloides]